jgi:hypothetical protein
MSQLDVTNMTMTHNARLLRGYKTPTIQLKNNQHCGYQVPESEWKVHVSIFFTHPTFSNIIIRVLSGELHPLFTSNHYLRKYVTSSGYRIESWNTLAWMSSRYVYVPLFFSLFSLFLFHSFYSSLINLSDIVRTFPNHIYFCRCPSEASFKDQKPSKDKTTRTKTATRNSTRSNKSPLYEQSITRSSPPPHPLSVNELTLRVGNLATETQDSIEQLCESITLINERLNDSVSVTDKSNPSPPFPTLFNRQRSSADKSHGFGSFSGTETPYLSKPIYFGLTGLFFRVLLLESWRSRT